MKLLDKYIIKKFLGTFFFTTALFLSIAVVFDVSEKMDDFLEKGAPVDAVITDYYFNFIIYYGNLFSSLMIFIAVIYFTSKLASNTEFIAMFSGGVSLYRLLWPYFIASTILAVSSFYLTNYLIPNTAENRLEFEATYLKTYRTDRYKNIQLQLAPDKFLYLETYNSNRKVGYQFILENFDGIELKSRLEASYLRYNDDKQIWGIENYKIRKFDGLKEELIIGKNLDTNFSFQPDELYQNIFNIETMDRGELSEFIEKQRAKGAENLQYFEIEQHQRVAYPFATYFLSLIALAIASRKVRGGIGVNIALGLLIGVSYILFMKVSTTFATNGNLSPGLSVWIPNILYAILGTILFRNAQK